MKKFASLLFVLVIGVIILAACQTNNAPAEVDAPAGDTPAVTTPADAPVIADAPDAVDVREAPPEGADTNNGRPFNLSPVAWDTRDTSRYLNGINATILPIVDNVGDLEIEIWFPFNSTIMTTMDESEVFQEAERRTNVVVNFFHPPVGSEADNFMLRIAADDLPHIFWNGHNHYPGGIAQAVQDGIAIDLTPYYNAGFMPNIEWLRNHHPLAEEINRGFMDDFGRMLAVIMIDIVPSHPWSGMWIRQDWLDDFGFAVPETIDDWDTILHAWRDATGTFVLGHNLEDWYGVQTNFAFAGAFDSGFRQFINMDGTVGHGSVQPGFREYLELMNRWWEAGIIDPDFATRTHDDYNSQVATGGFLAFGLAYGELGQAKMTGMHLEPRWQVTPVAMPTSRPGQVTRLGQNNSHVRGARAFLTDRVSNEGLQEPILRWMDWWYSQDGGDLASYGIEGHSFEWMPDGSFNFIHPSLDTPDADFWTLFERFKMHEWIYLRDSTAYQMEPEVWECIDVWGAQDLTWVIPDNRVPTPEEARDLAGIMADLDTHILEQTLAFITGTRPIDQFDAFVAELESMGIRRAEEIEQAAVTRYLSR